jgi:hypothetical protein
MPSAVVIDLFVEDRAHEEFVCAMVRRVAAECAAVPHVRVRSARGGHGRVLTELRAYQKALLGGWLDDPSPDVVVIAVDANCHRFTRALREIRDSLKDQLRGRSVIACPDPHVERWYLADPDSFVVVVGARPRTRKRKCQRDLYKRELAGAVARGGHPQTLGGLEFAVDLVRAMDLYRAGRNEPSLARFIEGLRSQLRLRSIAVRR